jgi:hypothetical protein
LPLQDYLPEKGMAAQESAADYAMKFMGKEPSISSVCFIKKKKEQLLFGNYY